ncbi:hypothetical protein I8752_13915 [Nostocaceae cyanobacterium CENA369]|uniref:Uncharacterized protein n=1 Tax=Dendronalium phyllosphericum CENA369 TaxID=1725256 RepID=A0A8J7I1R0_9NOST|nr:hypothetical protein [Dendronalium phyllosphericum]MBH8574096.1 hypothetical protein [Dendronalium phyllosphericum CENA369]
MNYSNSQVHEIHSTHAVAHPPYGVHTSLEQSQNRRRSPQPPFLRQGCFIRSDNDFVKSISQKFEVVGNCKITALTTKFKCDRLVFDPIRLFNDLIFLADTLVNKGLLGNETALLFKGGWGDQKPAAQL